MSDKIVGETPTKANAAYVNCAKAAESEGRGRLKDVLTRLLANPQTSAEGYSPIIDAVHAVSAIFRDRTITSKSLLLISDGIENTRATANGEVNSFYLPGGDERVRDIDAALVLESMVKAHRIPDLAGVRVWHSGFAQPAAGKAGLIRARSSSEISMLRRFWTQYWQMTKGDLVEFGQPLPLQPLTN